MVDQPDDAAVLAHIAAVSQRLLVDDPSVVASLQAVATAGCSLIEQCASASITILQGDRPATIACTDDTARALDDAQYRAGTGPCLAAAREVRMINLERTTTADEWPEFAAAAAQQQVASSLSVPLVLPGDATYGGLNLYGSVVGAFTADDRHVAQVFASQASAVVTNALAYWAAFEQSRHLTIAMESRAEIEQAKGILMATQRCSPEEAFDLLRRASQRENRKLREIAAEIVARASGREGT